MGRWGRSSVMGTLSGGPYVAQVELKTNFFTPHSTAASASLRALTKLLWKYFLGLVIDSPTRALAAKCMMASGLVDLTALRMSPSASGLAKMNLARGSTAERWPSVKL